MSESNLNKAVWFNVDEQQLFEQEKKNGKISQRNLKDFVHAAFYEKLDKINMRMAK